MAIVNQTKMSEDSTQVSDELWYVPLTYVTRNDRNVASVWLENVRQTELNLTQLTNDSWILVNIDETGFFRVNYDLRNWNLLTQQLRRNPNKIPVSNRGHLIDDAFQLANTGHINYTVAFNLVKYLNIAEINFVPWYAALRNMEELRFDVWKYLRWVEVMTEGFTGSSSVTMSIQGCMIISYWSWWDRCLTN